MQLKNTRTTYGSITKLFHWVVATLFILQFYWIGAKKYVLPPKSELGIKYLVSYHKPVGTILLVVGILMVLWRFINIKPYYLKEMPAWEKVIAKITQYLLYICILLMPLSGVMMTRFSGRTIDMFGYFTIPAFAQKNQDMASLFHEIHEYVGYVAFFIIILHTLAALKHHFYDKDNILKRMLPFSKI